MPRAMAAVCDRAPLPVGRPLLPPGPLSALLGDTSSPGPPPASPVSFSKALAEALLPAARRWPPGLSACPPGAPWRVCSGHDLTPTAGHVTWLDLESRFLTPCSQRVPVRLKTDSASCLRYAWQTVKCWTKLRAVTLTMIGSLPRSIPDLLLQGFLGHVVSTRMWHPWVGIWQPLNRLEIPDSRSEFRVRGAFSRWNHGAKHRLVSVLPYGVASRSTCQASGRCKQA